MNDVSTLFAHKRRRPERRTRLAEALLVPTAILCAVGLLGTSGHAQSPGIVTRLDPALDRIVPADSKLELLVEDYFGSTEGPVWVSAGGGGYLLFSDQAANRVYQWSADRKLSVFLEPSGYTGDPAKWMDVAYLFFNGRLNIGLIGSNGLAVDREGRLIMCAVGDRAIVRIEKDGTRTILADRYDGRPLPPPNDLVGWFGLFVGYQLLRRSPAAAAELRPKRCVSLAPGRGQARDPRPAKLSERARLLAG